MQVKYTEIKNFKYRINPEERQGAYGLYFIRPFSIVLTFLAIRLDISANQVTVGQILVGVVGSGMLSFVDPSLTLVGLILLQFGFVLDNVDGEVARFRGTVSLTGKYLDTVGHELVVPMLYFCVGLGNFARLGTIESVVLGFLAGLFSLRLDVITMSHEALQFKGTKSNTTFDYYERFEEGSVPSLYRQKNEKSLTRVLYGMFAYPAIMNIITIILLADLFFLHEVLASMRFNLMYVFLAVHGTLIPLRRVYTIWRFVHSRATEQTYLKLREDAEGKRE